MGGRSDGGVWGVTWGGRGAEGKRGEGRDAGRGRGVTWWVRWNHRVSRGGIRGVRGVRVREEGKGLGIFLLF